MGELYACNGHYEVVHGETAPGCGTAFAAGVGPDDIYEITTESVVEPSEHEEELGIGEEIRTDERTMKDHCPVCGLENVVVLRVDGDHPVAGE